MRLARAARLDVAAEEDYLAPFKERKTVQIMDQVSAHLDRGWDLVGRGDLQGAMRSAEKVLAIDATSPEAHNLIGFIFASEGRIDDALDSYRRAIELDPSFIEPRLNAADLLIHPIGRLDDALLLMNEALELAHTDEERVETLLLLVDVHLQRGNRELASKLLEELPPGPFDTPHLDLAIGRAHFDLGRLDDAETAVRLAFERGLRDADCFYYLGLIHEARERAADAAIAFLQAREADAQASRSGKSLPRERFERVVRSCIRRLPQELTDALEGTLVVVTDLPGSEVVADGLDPRVPALYSAPPLDAGVGAGALPSCLFVYQRNIERIAGTSLDDTLEEVLREEIGRAVRVPAAESEANEI